MVPKYFSRDCSTDSISCSEQKTRKKTRLKQDRKSRKEDKNVVVVANPTGSSSLCCRTAIDPLSHRYCSAVAPLLLRCRTAIAKLSLCCRSAVAPLSYHYRSSVAPLLLLRCRAAVAPLLHRYRSTVALLLSLLLSLRSRTAIAPLSHRC